MLTEFEQKGANLAFDLAKTVQDFSAFPRFDSRKFGLFTRMRTLFSSIPALTGQQKLSVCFYLYLPLYIFIHSRKHSSRKEINILLNEKTNKEQRPVFNTQVR